MQAIILAAGMGVRLKELTQNNTKCMLEINDEKLIDRVIKQLFNHQICKLIIVTGYCSINLENYLIAKYPTLPITFVHNPIYAQTNNIYSLSLVAEYLKQEDTILIESDLIFEENIINQLLSDPYPNLSVVAKYEYWMNGTMVKLDEDDKIIAFISNESFCFSDTSMYYKTVNLHKFSKEFSKNKYIPFLKVYMKVFGHNHYYEEVLSVLNQLNKRELKGLVIENEKWYEIDDPQDYYIAQILFSNDINSYSKQYGGYWRFPKLIDFCYLINPFFPPQRMLDEIKYSSDILLTSYPSGSSVNNQLAARMFNINPNYIILANGASELIKVLMNIIPGKTGVILPTFEEYFNCLGEETKIPYYVDNNTFNYTTEDVISFFEDKEISSLILINPDNPSGSLLDKIQISSLLGWSKMHNIILILDESFIDFSGEDASFLDDISIQNNPHLIIIKSISKSYGVPGIRLGILATSNSDIIQQVKNNLPIWNINSYAEFFMQTYLKYQIDYKSACKQFIDERTFLYNELTKISSLRVIPSKANYFLCDVISNYSSSKLTHKLLSEHNILIKDCSNKIGLKNKQYIRIAIKGRADNNKLLRALNTIENGKNGKNNLGTIPR